MMTTEQFIDMEKMTDDFLEIFSNFCKKRKLSSALARVLVNELFHFTVAGSVLAAIEHSRVKSEEETEDEENMWQILN